MSTGEILDGLRWAGYVIRMDGDKLRIKGPLQPVPPEVMKVLREHKEEIIKILRAQDDHWPVAYLREDGGLVIPSDCHPHFRWWQEGQTAAQTIEELKRTNRLN